mgnify:FL=1
MLTVLGSIALTLASAPAPTDGGRWFADYDEAVKVAVAEKKDLLVDFTGSDWCGWCKRLDAEVFQHEAFYSAAEKSFVLVKLDFPRDPEVKAKVPNPERNQELSERYSIQGFPTVLLMNTEGVVFGQTGYEAGGPEAYVQHLGTIAAAGKEALVEVSKLDQAFKNAKDERAKLAALTAALDFLDRSEAAPMLLEPLFGVAREAFVIDAENKAGLGLRSAKLLLAKGQWDAKVQGAAQKYDPKNEAGLIEQCLLAQIQQVSDADLARAFTKDLLGFLSQGLAIQDKPRMASFAANAARWNAEESMLNDPAAALALAKHALELDPEGAAAEMLKEMIEELGQRTGTEG